GKFGLGFYSAFMVADKVEIITRSYKVGEDEAAHWICDGSTEFELEPYKKAERGTDVILHINKDSEEFLDEWRLKGILEKYCKFLPVEIKFGMEERSEPDGEDKDRKPKYKTVKRDRIINNTNPLWTRPPSELKDEDYLAFYKAPSPFTEDALVGMQRNVEHDFTLTGIVCFPKVKNDFDVHNNEIQLYSRHVLITDDAKEGLPECLRL